MYDNIIHRTILACLSLLALCFCMSVVSMYYNKNVCANTDKCSVEQKGNTVSILNANNDPVQVYSDPVQIYDDINLNDPFVRPTARPASYLYGPMMNNPVFNYPTRGYPDSPAYIANLVETRLLHTPRSEETKFDDRSVLQLMGQQQYPGSYKYNYYALLTSNRNPPLKIEINTKKRNDELYDGDEVIIPELGNKRYTVRKNASPFEYYLP